MTEKPKTINCRLGETDNDIQEDLVAHQHDKTNRIKSIYRMGLQYEAMCQATHLIPDTQTVAFYRVAIEDLRIKKEQEKIVPSPLLYTK